MTIASSIWRGSSLSQLLHATWLRAMFSVAVSIAFLLPCPKALAQNLNTVVHFNIKAQPLNSALLDFGRQAHVQIMFASKVAWGQMRTEPMVGKYTGREALAELLRRTQLGYVVRGNTVEIVPDPDKINKENSHTSLHEYRRNKAGSKGQRHQDPGGKAGQPKKKSREINKIAALHEVLVTGTHIVGIKTTASPIQTYSRNEIYATGAGNIGNFIQTLSASLGDVSEQVTGAEQGGPSYTLGNSVDGVGFDLRGLGAQSTLVLVNGQRVAPGGQDGNFTDVSLIPLSIISHIDVETDSESAVYGSDAVGGVVNINTLRAFNGSETRLRYGSVTNGGRHETQASETWGSTLSGGSVVLGYEYADQTPLAAASRTFTENAPPPYDLLPEESRHGLYASLSKALQGNVVINGFALYGHRNDTSNFVNFGTIFKEAVKVSSYIVDVSMRKKFESGGIGTASVDYSRNDSALNEMIKGLGTVGAFVPYDSPHGRGLLVSSDLGYSGWFGHLNGGRVGFAAGIQAREERFRYTNYSGGLAAYTKSRLVMSEYMEIEAPVLPRLRLTVSARHERYSDFGSTINPKVGLAWTPSKDVAVTGTYSTAFVAPSVNELVPSDNGVYAPLPDPKNTAPCNPYNPSDRAGCTNTLLISGGNPNLGPEKAKTWTAGVRLHPRRVPNLDAVISIYDIRYDNIINTAFSVLPSVLDCLEYSGTLGPAVVQRNLNTQQLQKTYPQAGNPLGIDESTVTTLCDGRFINVSRLTTSGVDFDIKYFAAIHGVLWHSELSGTRILSYRSRFSSVARSKNFLNTAYNPVALRLRFGEIARVGPFSGAVFANFTGPYKNNRVTPEVPIASWTTIDMSATYRVHLGTRHSNAVITAGVTNLTDKNPPFVLNPTVPLNFDGANANSRGRFVYIQLSVKL